MTNVSAVPFEMTTHVRDACLCLHTQRAARALARRFDAALRPTGLTHGQFSLLMALNRPAPASTSEVAALLGADRTTLTAAFKPLLRQGLVEAGADTGDSRVRRIALTAEGKARLADALPLWVDAHAALETELAGVEPARLKRDLNALAARRPGDLAPALCDDEETPP